MNDKEILPVSEHRRFIRHPLCFPLTYTVLEKGPARAAGAAEEKKSTSINVSMGGILFASRKPVKPDTMIVLKMPFQDKVFNIRARVVHCNKNPETKLYNIGAAFHKLSAAYKVKLIEQLYLISEFRDLKRIQLGKEITLENASKEWIKRYSARFKRLYWCFAVMAIAAAMLALPALASQGVDEAVTCVRSPEDIARFFSREFRYAMTLPDRVRSPEEMLETRSGDCEDFAILASEMLTRMGVENQVIIIKFSGLRIMHAICAWKGDDGFCNFISNQEFQRTGQRTVEAAVRKFYPDCAGMAVIDPKRYVKESGGGGISSAKAYRGSELMTDLDPRTSTGL
jgi:hypothetical protein